MSTITGTNDEVTGLSISGIVVKFGGDIRHRQTLETIQEFIRNPNLWPSWLRQSNEFYFFEQTLQRHGHSSRMLVARWFDRNGGSSGKFRPYWLSLEDIRSFNCHLRDLPEHYWVAREAKELCPKGFVSPTPKTTVLRV